MPDSELRRKVSELCASDNGYGLALMSVTKHIDMLRRMGGRDREVAEAQLIKAEVLQKLGDLTRCQQELDRVSRADLSPSSSQGWLLIRARVLMQLGDLKVSRVALQSLRDRMGHGGVAPVYQVYLWRQSFVTGVLGGTRDAARLRDEHRELVLPEGFQLANNVLYAEVLPQLSADRAGFARRQWIDLARQAGRIYATSTVDFSQRLGHRGKSLCEALLTEALVLWLVGNRFNSYRTAFTAALLLRHAHLHATTEGIGEVLAVLDGKAPELAEGVRLVIGGADDVVPELEHASDYGNPLAAYYEAVDIAAELSHRPDFAEVYQVLDEWS
ncbi:MAG TPA: hypothetical protein VJX10_08870 [Pseudonocardiaceae bacterium]|nr:hypothetical protein [Pseudonocardiaceae bacterium]